MTYQEFSKLIGGGWNDKVQVACQVPGCKNVVVRQKGSALTNFNRNNGVFKCPSCSVTEEGRKRIAKATSYKRSDETKRKMSKAKKAFYKTPEGAAYRKRQSKITALQHANTNMDKSKRKVLYISAKNNNEVRVCNSSGEFIACEDFFEKDPNIIKYESQVYYEINGRSRSLDFLLYYKNGTKKSIEVKPKKRITEEENVLQIADSSAYAQQQGWQFELWTESELGITKWKETTRRADEYRKTHYLVDYAAYRAEKDKKRAKRHYDNKISNDKVIIYCDFCKDYHATLRVTYNRNIDRNGTYICERHGGHIAGKRPKLSLRKENPFAGIGKKKCTKCDRILPCSKEKDSCFSPDKSKRDGFSTRCKECRANFYRDKYQKKNP